MWEIFFVGGDDTLTSPNSVPHHFEGCIFIQSNMYQAIIILPPVEMFKHFTNQWLLHKGIWINLLDNKPWSWIHKIGLDDAIDWAVGSSQCVPIMFPLISHWVFNVFPDMFSIARHFYPICFGKCCPLFHLYSWAKGEGFYTSK
jgi:hypothetical protein